MRVAAARSAIGVLALLAFHSVNAQARNANWLFHDDWISFSSGQPVNVPGPQFCAGSSLSDTLGNLRVYISGGGQQGIRGPNHALVANFLPADQEFNNACSPQGAILVPKPGDPYRAYAFVIEFHGSQGDTVQRAGVLELDLGDANTNTPPVAVDNAFTWFMEGTTVKRMAVPHANGTDYWIVLQPVNSNAFHAYRISTNGIGSPPVISQAGPFASAAKRFGTMIPSNAGDRFISVMGPQSYAPSAGLVPSVTGLFQFDAQTGEVSHVLDLPELNRVKGAEFSPNDRFLYITEGVLPVSGSIGTRYLWQYDLEASDIPASRVLVHSYPMMGFQSIACNTLAIAPDRRIYVSHDGTASLFMGIINSPNELAPACDYIHHGFDPDSGVPELPAPMKSYQNSPTMSGVGVTAQTATSALRVLPNPATGNAYLQGLPANAVRAIVRDVLGRVVQVETVSLASFDVSALPSGSYSVEVQGLDGMRLGLARFVKE